jgi:excisionase family DNA binding protein
MDKDLMSYADAALFLGLPIGTLYAMVSQRGVPHVRLGPRLVRFSRVALERWVAEHAVPCSASRSTAAAAPTSGSGRGT